MAKPKQSGLGRGLGELFRNAEDGDAGVSPDGTAEVGKPSAPLPDGSFFELIPTGEIHPNPKQPRTVFDEEALSELTESLREVGMLQPVVVRQLGDHNFELVMGERRWRASQAAGMTEVPAIVRATEDGDLLRDALLENLHRAQLNPLEEAAAYQQMLDEFGCTQEELANRIKRSRPQISNTIRLLRLPAPVQRRVAAGVLSAGHARALLALDDPAAQERLAQRIVAEGMSVRATEEVVALGDQTPAERKARGPKQDNPREAEIADDLSDLFDTRVKVAIGKNRGRITIEFGDGEDLERVLTILRRHDPAP